MREERSVLPPLPKSIATTRRRHHRRRHPRSPRAPATADTAVATPMSTPPPPAPQERRRRRRRNAAAADDDDRHRRHRRRMRESCAEAMPPGTAAATVADATDAPRGQRHRLAAATAVASGLGVLELLLLLPCTRPSPPSHDPRRLRRCRCLVSPGDTSAAWRTRHTLATCCGGECALRVRRKNLADTVAHLSTGAGRTGCFSSSMQRALHDGCNAKISR